MTSADLYKSFLAKSTFTSGNIENAETVDGLDADMTGESSKGKSSSSPGGFTDQEEENKKVKKKVDKNAKNGGETKSVAEQVGFSDSDVGKETKLQNVGPYDIGGDVDDDIGVPPSGQLIDGYILRSEQLGDLLKGGEGSRGGKIIGHTKSGKAVYANAKKVTGFNKQDHKDASHLHDQEANKHFTSAAGQTLKDKNSVGGHLDNEQGHAHKAASKWHAAQATAMHQATKKSFAAPDHKTYDQRVEQHGFITVTSGGMDDYLANLSKGNSFYANGTDHHTPCDENSVGQTLCKSCDQAHSSLYGVCPNCSPRAAMSKSFSRSQEHRGAFDMPGQVSASGLVDMSRFSLED